MTHPEQILEEDESSLVHAMDAGIKNMAHLLEAHMRPHQVYFSSQNALFVGEDTGARHPKRAEYWSLEGETRGTISGLCAKARIEAIQKKRTYKHLEQINNHLLDVLHSYQNRGAIGMYLLSTYHSVINGSRTVAQAIKAGFSKIYHALRGIPEARISYADYQSTFETQAAAYCRQENQLPSLSHQDIEETRCPEDSLVPLYHAIQSGRFFGSKDDQRSSPAIPITHQPASSLQ
jgi:hypothetical protein